MKFSKKLLLFILAVLLCLPGAALAAAPESAGNVSALSGTKLPVVLLKHWNESTEQEQYGFLVGFLTALQMEREWQGANPLPLRQSLAGNWSKGLEGITLKEIHSSVNAHIAADPADMNRPLVEYLWFTFVQPKVTETLDAPQPEPLAKSVKKKSKKTR